MSMEYGSVIRRHLHYAIFWTDRDTGRAMWCRARTKRAALRAARYYRGVAGALGFGHRDAWDAPTFRNQMDTIADYRGGGEMPMTPRVG